MAPQPVVVSGRIVAYYGHICASGGRPTVYGLCRGTAGPPPPAPEGPQFTPPIRLPHAAARTPVVPTTALDDIFIAGVLPVRDPMPDFPKSGLCILPVFHV